VEKVVERLHPDPGAPIPEIARPAQVDPAAKLTGATPAQKATMGTALEGIRWKLGGPVSAVVTWPGRGRATSLPEAA
jgi:hypothetical protein